MYVTSSNTRAIDKTTGNGQHDAELFTIIASGVGFTWQMQVKKL
jgi:hypothetical protein